MSEVRLQVKKFLQELRYYKAVQNVSFNVNKGEVHALIGEKRLRKIHNDQYAYRYLQHWKAVHLFWMARKFIQRIR